MNFWVIFLFFIVYISQLSIKYLFLYNEEKVMNKTAFLFSASVP